MSEQKNDKPAYLLDEATVYKLFNTERPGLEDAVAKSRLQQNGANQLEAKNPLPTYKVSTAVQRPYDCLAGHKRYHLAIPRQPYRYRTFALVAFNTIIGFTQEYKAERIMESLVSCGT